MLWHDEHCEMFTFLLFWSRFDVLYFQKKNTWEENVHTRNNSSSPRAHMFVPGGYFITENVQFYVFKAHWDHQHRSTAEASHQIRIIFAFLFSGHFQCCSFFSFINRSHEWNEACRVRRKQKKVSSLDFNLFRITNQFNSQISCFKNNTQFSK